MARPWSATILALPLGACSTVSDDVPNSNAVSAIEQDILEYVASNWENYWRGFRHSTGMEIQEYKLAGLELITCNESFGGASCTIEATVELADGELVKGRVGGHYGYHDGEISEMIIVG